MLTDKKKEYLENAHATYANYNQEERSDCALMAANGHPATKGYQRMRAFFDKLKYASNSSARYFSMVDKHNISSISAPKLDISWRAGFEYDGVHYHEVYPAMGDIWDAYIVDLAKRGWKKCEAEINFGYISIKTTDDDMVKALADVVCKCDPMEYEDEPQLRSYQFFPRTYAEHYELLRVIKQFHKGNILPKRTKEDIEKDSAALPMQEKQVFLGNTDEVVVNDRTILVPLIPIGESENAKRIVSNIADTLTDCLKNGLPWEQASSHLKKVLLPEPFKRLESQYA